MVLIKVDRVYELTILLCGLETERERESERRGDWEGMHMQAVCQTKKVGSFGEKRKYRRGKGGREKCSWE